MERSADIGDLASALAKAQGEMKLPGKNREVKVSMKSGGQYKFEYTTLDHMIEHVRPHLTKHGLWFIQTVANDNGKSVLDTTLTHSSGQWVTGRMPLVVGGGDNANQAFGSALTYMRRYALAAMLGIASEEDDDGNAAEGNSIAERRDRAANGNHAPQPSPPAPAKRSVAPPPEGEAQRWAKQAMADVAQLKREGDIRRWEDHPTNVDNLLRLKAVSPGLHREVTSAIAERYGALSTMNAG